MSGKKNKYVPPSELVEDSEVEQIRKTLVETQRKIEATKNDFEKEKETLTKELNSSTDHHGSEDTKYRYSSDATPSRFFRRDGEPFSLEAFIWKTLKTGIITLGVMLGIFFIYSLIYFIFAEGDWLSLVGLVFLSLLGLWLLSSYSRSNSDE